MTEEHPNVTLAHHVFGVAWDAYGLIAVVPEETDAKLIVQMQTEALAKELAIRLAIHHLEQMKARNIARGLPWPEVEDGSAAIKNLLIGLGCEAVVDAWNEVG